MPHQCAHWFAMTSVSMIFCVDFCAECFENTVIARSGATWQSVTPAFEKCHCPKGNRRDKSEFEKHLGGVGVAEKISKGEIEIDKEIEKEIETDTEGEGLSPIPGAVTASDRESAFAAERVCDIFFYLFF